MPIVLTNAGPLIALGKLNRLELLVDLYREIQTTPVVYDEVVTQGLARGAPDALTVRLFWQRYGWPVVDVSSADVLDTRRAFFYGTHGSCLLAVLLPTLALDWQQRHAGQAVPRWWLGLG